MAPKGLVLCARSFWYISSYSSFLTLQPLKFGLGFPFGLLDFIVLNSCPTPNLEGKALI
jgi:hypothetical protein